MQDLVVEAQEREEELRLAIETEQDEKVQALTAEVARLQTQLQPLPKETQGTEVFLQNSPTYIDTYNDFEAQDDVVLDRVTGLMWQFLFTD